MTSPPPLDFGQLYRVLAETAPDAIVAIDETGTLLSVNPAAEVLFGYRSEELVGRSLSQLMPARFRERHDAGLRRYVITGERNIPWRAVSLPILTRDGREVPSEISFGELTAGGRRVFSGIIRDVSARVAADAALAESATQLQEQAIELEHQIEEAQSLSEELEESNDALQRINADLEAATAIAEAQASRIGEILSTLTDAVSVFDDEWRWTYRNAAAADVLRSLGRDPDAVIGHVLWEEIPELLGTQFETETRRAVDTHTIVEYEEYLPVLERWFETRIVPSTAAVTTFTRDVTERRRAEEVLRHQEEEFRALANTIPSLAWMARPDGWIYWYNERWYQYTGTAPADMEGWGWQRVHDPRALPDVMEGWTRSIATGEPFEMVFPLRSAQGDYRRFLTRVAPLRDKSNTIVRWFGVNTDVEAQRASREASELLAEASALLASSTDYDETLATVARIMVPRLGDWAAVDLVDDPSAPDWPPVVRRVAVVHGDPSKLALGAELTAKYPERWDDPNGMAGVIRDGRSLFLPEVSEEMVVAGARDAEHLRLLRAIDFHSIMVVPITARGQVLGALSLCMTESHQHYGEADLALAEDLGRRAGGAIDTVRLLRDARDARRAAEAAVERTTRLQHVTGLLAGALTERQVADLVIAEGIPALDASDGVIYLLSDDGHDLVHAASAGMPAATTEEFRVFPVMAELPLAEVVRTGETIVLGSREEVLLRYPGLRDASARSRTVAWIAVPLRAGDRTLGGMVLGFDAERHFDAADRTFAETLARLCGQALLRARLYDDAERARAQAEEANSAKLAFLATMSHELRTPLNAIAGHVQLIDMELHGPVTDAQRNALDRVNRAQAHLLGLINDILTYAKVESGRVMYEIRPTDPAMLLREVCALVEPQFISKGLRLVTDLPTSSSTLLALADRDKLMQVMLNLLSNALKFTPSPGEVSLALSAVGGGARTVEITVRDSGDGVPPDKLEAIFEPFVQLGRSLSTTHEGTGLGLAVSRDLARGMGGDLTVSSLDGEGAVFTVVLPRAEGGAD